MSDFEFPPNENPNDFIQDDKLDNNISDCNSGESIEYEWSELDEFVEGINSGDYFKQSSGLIGIRKLLSQDPNNEDDIQRMIDAGLLPKLVEFMKKDDEPKLQLNATRALFLISAGNFDQVGEVIDQGAVPVLVDLLKLSSNMILKLVVVTAIREIITHKQHQNLVFASGVLHPLIAFLKDVLLDEALAEENDILIKRMSETLSILCQEDGSPAYEKVADAAPALFTLLKEVTNIEACKHVLNCLSCFTDEEHKIARVLEANIIPCLVGYLDCPDNTIIVLTLKFIGKMIENGSDDQADAILNVSSTKRLMKNMFKLLKERYDQQSIVAYVYYTLGIISLRKNYHSLILKNAEYLQQCIDHVSKADWDAIQFFNNLVSEINKFELLSIIGILDHICKLVQQELTDQDVIDAGVVIIFNLLRAGAMICRKEATNNLFLIKVKQSCVLNGMKELKGRQNSGVPRKVYETLEKYSQETILRKKLRLKRAIICFRKERHSLFGLLQNEKKKLCI